MKTFGKKYQSVVSLIDAGKVYPLAEALALLPAINTAKFDQSVELHANLNLDPRHADQQLRCMVSLPHGTGKTVRIAAFSDTHDAKKLQAAGAHLAGGDDLVAIIESGKIDFDIAIATPNMMKKMGKIAKILGPKGLMPNPKTGTVGEDLETIISEIAAGKVEIKNDKYGSVHVLAGKLSFGDQKLSENILALFQAIQKNRPSGVKNPSSYVKNLSLCLTMSPSIKIVC